MISNVSVSPRSGSSRLAPRLLLALAVASAIAGGLRAIAADSSCPVCHRTGQPGWRFCPFDGALLEEPAPAPAAVSVTALPEPGGARVPRKSAASPRDNPLATIDDLFRAVERGDQDGILRLYRWEVFFPGVSAASLEQRTRDYARRLVQRVRPTLAGRTRVPLNVKMSDVEAEIDLELRDATRERVASYEFRLTHQDDGWKIVGVRP